MARIKPSLLLVYEGAQPIDVAGPLQTFSTANEEIGSPRYRFSVVSLGAKSVRLQGGLAVVPEACPRGPFDILLIPGGPGAYPASHDPGTVRKIRRLARDAARICSVCTGAFFLAAAGWLDGRAATTHWRSASRLASEYPSVGLDSDRLWVRDGNVWTSAGVTSGIDMALAIVEEDAGRAIASRVARRLVVYLRRHGGQSQYSEPLALQSTGGFEELMQWALQNIERGIGIGEMADKASMSERTFYRRFAASTGTTPAKAIEKLRLERAMTLIQTTRLPMSAIAARTGFRSEDRMRHSFLRKLGINPTDWRGRF